MFIISIQRVFTHRLNARGQDWCLAVVAMAVHKNVALTTTSCCDRQSYATLAARPILCVSAPARSDWPIVGAKTIGAAAALGASVTSAWLDVAAAALCGRRCALASAASDPHTPHGAAAKFESRKWTFCESQINERTLSSYIFGWGIGMGQAK